MDIRIRVGKDNKLQFNRGGRPKRALITGITGQDGSYLAELLLDKGYKVYGLVRRTSKPDLGNSNHLADDITVIYGDVTDMGSLIRAVNIAQPDEVYNLAAQSFVGGSWDFPVSTVDITGMGALRLLEALRLHWPDAKIYQASSSEMFGDQGGLLDERSPFRPRSPYGFAKVMAHNAAVNYRESYGMFVSCGILFNHESPRRGPEFVTRKITKGLAAIVSGEAKDLRLGNIDSQRDWGHARDYVRGMHLMLQAKEPDDYVLATGMSHSIKEFLELSFKQMQLNWEDYVKIDPKFYRPAEINTLRGNSWKAYEKLGWKPEISFEGLVRDMVNNDLGGEE